MHAEFLGILAVLLAALGAFGSGTGWPDTIVAAIMGILALQGSGDRRKASAVRASTEKYRQRLNSVITQRIRQHQVWIGHVAHDRSSGRDLAITFDL
jgi:hypothetical protein